MTTFNEQCIYASSDLSSAFMHFHDRALLSSVVLMFSIFPSQSKGAFHSPSCSMRELTHCPRWPTEPRGSPTKGTPPCDENLRWGELCSPPLGLPRMCRGRGDSRRLHTSRSPRHIVEKRLGGPHTVVAPHNSTKIF